MRVRKIILTLAILALAAFLPLQNTYANEACESAGINDPLLCGTAGSDEETVLQERVRSTLNVVYVWIGIIAVIFIVVGGYKYLTAAGSSEKVQGAKNTIMYSTAGLVVTLSAFAITQFTLNALTGQVAQGGGSAYSGSSSADRNKVKDITVVSNTRMLRGQTLQLKTKLVPDYATNKELSYKIADTSIATIDQAGKVTAKNPGETTATISSSDGVSKDVKITVVKPVEVQSIKLSKTATTIERGKTETIKATTEPQNAIDKTIEWSSANTNVATVSQKGVIKAINAGTTTITVKARNQSIVGSTTDSIASAIAAESSVSATVKVTVTTTPYATSTTPTTARKLTRDKKFTAETQKIVNAHKNDFNCSNFNSFMKKHGGYTAYVKSLGGIFAKMSGSKQKVKTAADLQAYAEYVYGLWTIWGPDYNNNQKYIYWGSSDAFYQACPAQRYLSYGYAGNKHIDKILSSSTNVRTHCNGSVNIFMKSMNIKWPGSSANPRELLRRGGKKITKVSDLQVGDIMAFYESGNWRHTAIVGEVYQDYVVTYDGGSGSIGAHNFKRKVKRVNSTKFSGGYSYKEWYAVRVWDLDQSVTLEGL